MFKNVGSQKLTVLAFADGGHASLDAGDRVTGDSANITLKIEQDDDGTRSASNDTNPTETEDGQYVFDLTQAESNGDKLTFYPESSTAGVQVVALPSNVIYTRPRYFSDLGIASDGDLSKVNTLDGHTAQTGDSYARLGAPAGASVSADVATIDTNVDTLVTRIPAALFSGITSLAQWLGQMAGKQAANATAQTEIRATGGGSGTYDATTDSLEAVKDSQPAAAPTAAQVADQVWDEATAGHTTAGTFGAQAKTVLDTVNTNVSTLLGRITATLFTGITSLAEWLGAMAGKQVADTTARNEIQATGAGSGTFSELTDSQEAIKDAIGTPPSNITDLLGDVYVFHETSAAAGSDSDTVWMAVNPPADPSGHFIKFWTGVLAGQMQRVESYSAGIAEMESPFSQAPGVGDKFYVLVAGRETKAIHEDWKDAGRLDSILDSAKANTDTLLARITSTLFTGITSLAQWLGAMAGKQTSDATAQTEMRATGAGSGSYDATTDSQQAIRDNQSGGGGGGGSTNVILGAIQISKEQVNDVTSPITLRMFEDETKTFLVTVKDAEGAVVDLSGMTLRCVFHDELDPPGTLFKVEDPELSVSGDNSEVANIKVLASNVTSANRNLRWSLRDVTDDSNHQVLAHGPFEVLPSAPTHP